MRESLCVCMRVCVCVFVCCVCAAHTHKCAHTHTDVCAHTYGDDDEDGGAGDDWRANVEKAAEAFCGLLSGTL